MGELLGKATEKPPACLGLRFRRGIDAAQVAGAEESGRRSEPHDEHQTFHLESARKCSHRHGYFNRLTSTLDLRPLCSYFSRRGGGKSSGVPSTKPPFDWKYVNACVDKANNSSKPLSR